MERNPKYAESLRTIRTEIKKLANDQKKLKALRKQDAIVTPELRDELDLTEWADPAQRVIANRGRITALLNFHLAARGKEYRHNVNGRSAWTYAKKMKELVVAHPELAAEAQLSS